MYREEGFTRLWKGNTATILKVIPYSATQFAAFRGYSHLIACAGATATCIAYPFDFLRTRMAVREGDATYKNIGVAIRSIAKEEVGVARRNHV